MRWLEDEYVFPVGLGGTTILNRDFEQFWTDIGTGSRFRYYGDRTTETGLDGNAPPEYVFGPNIARNGTSAAEPETVTWDKLWKMSIDMFEYVA
jgi:hypothetical protein